MGNDHVHILIDYPPSQSVSDLVKPLKERTSRSLQQAFPELQKRDWGSTLGDRVRRVEFGQHS